MILYSEKIILFIQEVHFLIRKILVEEIGLKVHGSRFLDKEKRHSYPICVVIYNNKSMLGYFDPEFYELGFHERLLHFSKKDLENIIRHELAHYMTFILHGQIETPHGNLFKSFCKSLGWDEEIYRASLSVEEISSIEKEESSILRKVKKLMALATSANSNESEAAMIKSRELLLKHNLESCYLDSSDDKIFLCRLLSEKRQNAKMHCISKILETFFVSVVFHRGKELIHLEVVGENTNIEIAKYVADHLNLELERLFDETKKKHPSLSGKLAKNSFFYGIAKGYCNKVQSLKKSYTDELSNALVVIEKKLALAKNLVYSRLTSSKSGGRYCQKSSSLGEKIGSLLQINPAVSSSKSSSKAISDKSSK